jgi:hypothetical protein
MAMNLNQVKQLHNGDEVFWNDPDHGACSRYIIIQSTTVEKGSDIISVYGKDGSYLQCFAHELS